MKTDIDYAAMLQKLDARFLRPQPKPPVEQIISADELYHSRPLNLAIPRRVSLAKYTRDALGLAQLKEKLALLRSVGSSQGYSL